MVKKSPQKESPQSVGTLDPEMRALGMIETRGLVACIEAADAMAKASNIAENVMRHEGEKMDKFLEHFAKEIEQYMEHFGGKLFK